MKAAVITGIGTSEVTTVHDPTPGPRHLIVDVPACGLEDVVGAVAGPSDEFGAVGSLARQLEERAEIGPAVG